MGVIALLESYETRLLKVIDCIRGNSSPMINLPIYFILLFFPFRVHRQEESKHERPGKQRHLSDFPYKQRRSSPSVLRRPRGEVGATTPGWLWWVRSGSRAWYPRTFLPQPRCFQIKQCSSMAVWTLPLLPDHFAFGNGAQKKSTATSQGVPVLSFPQRCHLARFLQAFSNAPLFVTFQKTNLSFFFFFFPRPLWVIWFCPFLLSRLSCSAHSSTALSVDSSSLKPCKSYFFPKRSFTESGKLLQSVSVYELIFAAQKILHCKISTRL